MYRITFANRQAERSLERLPASVRERIRRAVHLLEADLRPGGVRKLSGGFEGLWRIRMGGYRVVYAIDDERRLIGITGIEHRRDSYR